MNAQEQKKQQEFRKERDKYNIMFLLKGISLVIPKPVQKAMRYTLEFVLGKILTEKLTAMVIKKNAESESEDPKNIIVSDDDGGTELSQSAEGEKTFIETKTV
ncbi:MAG: hypothetical protein ACTSXQ_03620 [Alphaproteobacteria bacterium]